MTDRRTRYLRRVAAVSAGVVLAGSTWTGVALADDPTPGDPIGGIIDGVTGGGSGSGGSLPIPSLDTPAIPVPGLPALPALPGLAPESNPIAPLLESDTTTPTTTPTTTTSGSSTTTTTSTTGNATICNQLAGQLTGLLDQLAPLQQQAATTPVGPLLTALLGQIAPLQAQANAVSQQLATLLCSFIPGAGGGTDGSVPTDNPSSGRTDYSVRYPWNHGHRFYDRGYRYPDVQVRTTQVRSVPKGGVDTGDGSF